MITLPKNIVIEFVMVASLHHCMLSSVVASEIADDLLRRPLDCFTVNHNYPVRNALFSPDGKKLVTVTYNNMKVTIVDALTGSIIITLDDDELTGTALFTSDGGTLATVSYKKVKIWDLLTYALLNIVNHDDYISSVACNNKGTELLTASYDKKVNICNVQTGDIRAILRHNAQVCSATFNDDDTLIATASQDKIVRIWNALTGELLQRLDHSNGLFSYVVSAIFNPKDSNQIITTCNRSNIVRVWDIKTEKVRTILNHDGPVMNVCYGKNGEKLISTSYENGARIWDLGKEITFKKLVDMHCIDNISFNSDDTLLVTTYISNTMVHIWHALTGTLLKGFGHDQQISSASFNHDSTKLVITSYDGTATLFDLGPIYVAAHFNKDFRPNKKLPLLKHQALLALLSQYSNNSDFKGIDNLLKNAKTCDLEDVLNSLPDRVNECLRQVYKERA